MEDTSAVSAAEHAPPPCTRRAQDADLDQMAASVRGWETRLTQLGPGPGRGSVVETVLPAARLVRLVVETWA
ncbi:MAG: hypothetical protein P8170_21520, partial [Gemmatimonadota bacterium]